MASSRNPPSADPTSPPSEEGEGNAGGGIKRRKRPPILQTHLKHFLQRHFQPGQTLLLGLSGGLDSRVLLHLLVQLRSRLKFDLSAMHVHHGISPHADAWAQFCADLCVRDQVPFEVVRVSVPRDSGLGLEAAARAERYRVLLGRSADAVMLAHHEDDQAETILLQLLRGAGVKGLAAMGESSERQPATGGREKPILRPLLNVSRAELLDYAKAHDLQWIEDESNLDLAYDRNFLRHHVLPQMEQRFPACRRTLARSASHLAEAAELLEEIAREDASKAVVDSKLNLAELGKLSASRANNLLRYWLTEVSGMNLSAARIADICRQLLDARIDARIGIKIGSRTLRRKRSMAFME